MANQFETRTGIKGATAGEQLRTDPFLLAIVAPAPKDDYLISVELGDVCYRFEPFQFVGPNDSTERGIGWDPAFDWGAKQPAEFEALILSLFHEPNNRTILAQHGGKRSYAIVNDGRHTVLALRIANLLRQKLKKEPGKIGFIRRDKDEAATAVMTGLANRQFKRDFRAEAERDLYTIEINGWDDAQAARHFGVSVATIRNWRKRVDAPAEQKQVKSKAPKRPARKMVEKLFAAMKDNPDTPKESLEILQYCLTGEATKALKRFLE
jgi:transposase